MLTTLCLVIPKSKYMIFCSAVSRVQEVSVWTCLTLVNLGKVCSLGLKAEGSCVLFLISLGVFLYFFLYSSLSTFTVEIIICATQLCLGTVIFPYFQESFKDLGLNVLGKHNLFSYLRCVLTQHRWWDTYVQRMKQSCLSKNVNYHFSILEFFNYSKF